MVQHLISLGADPCNRGNNGKTPLQIAVQKSNLEMVKLLVNNGADPTIPCGFLEAIATKNVEIFKYLLEKGPPINGIYKNGDTPLIKAMEAGNFQIIQCLVKTGAQMPHSERIKQFLLKYIEKSNLEMVKWIVEAGVNVNTIYENGDTPIMKALECPNSVLIIKYLMEKGAKFPSVDKINQSGMLIKAVESKNHLIVKLLVDNGADVDQIDSNGRLPLIVAATIRAFSVIKILIEAGANIDLAKNELDNFANCNDDFAFYLQNQKKMFIMKRPKNIILF